MSAPPLLDLTLDPASTATTAPAPSLAGWARDRGLTHLAHGLLQPVTPRLRKGLGVGTHRSLRAGSSGRQQKRPERSTSDICRGSLPGGIEGVLAHHTHLTEDSSDEGGSRWLAWTSTVVLAELGDAARAVCTASAGRRTPMRALASFGRPRPSSDPRRTTVPPPTTQELRDGRTWTISPAEDGATLDMLAAASAPALAEAPDGVEVEVEFGVLCVWVGRELTDGAELDALCRAASAVANGLRTAAERHPPLDPAAPVGPHAQTDRRRWIEAGVATVDWGAPPPDVPAAVAAYEAVVRGRARRFGSLVGLGLLALALAGLAGATWIGLETGMAQGGAITAIFVVVVVAGILRSVFGVAREVARDEVDARALPWGLEAFLRGHAAARGLTLEDPDALRRRFAGPLRGRAVGALHGRLAGRVDGHLVLWREPGAGTPAQQWLLAIVPSPGHLPATAAPYHAVIRGDLLVVGAPVEERDRSAAALDRLAAFAASLTAPVTRA